MIINFFIAAVLAGAPLIFATVGEIITEKSGNINLGVEGTMYIGAVGALAGALAAEKVGLAGMGAVAAAFIAALFCGMLTSMIYCLFTVSLRVNQNVIGLTITILGTGIGNFFGELMGQNAGGYISVTDTTKAFYSNNIFSLNWLVYVSVLAALVSFIILFKTGTGLRLLAVGENPAAADSVGISVTRYRYAATMIGGGLCGISGMYMCMVSNSGVWVHNCISGYGWLAVALVILSGWNTLRAVPCSIVFGALMVMRLYISIPGINPFIYDMCPYIVTCCVIIVMSMRKYKHSGLPQGCGENYYREER